MVADQVWQAVASDASGQHLVAVSQQDEYNFFLSTDSGATWSESDLGGPQRGWPWTSVASDSTGTHLVGASNEGDVALSNDSGASWTLTQPTPAAMLSWGGAAINAAGSIAVVNFGLASDVWISSNEGASWTDATAGGSAEDQPWSGIASDGSGAHLVAVTQGDHALDVPGDIWTSANGGGAWVNRTTGTPASGITWTGVASDSSGAHLVAISAGGGIWTSTDSGATWTHRDTGDDDATTGWVSVASDGSGAHLVAAQNPGYVCVSSDGGATWVHQSGAPSGSWAGVASDATGAHLVGVMSIGGIWTN
jgi:hypothetical protein